MTLPSDNAAGVGVQSYRSEYHSENVAEISNNAVLFQLELPTIHSYIATDPERRCVDAVVMKLCCRTERNV